jgi:hypothetical protein
MIINIIDLLRALDFVQGSQLLTAAEKATVAKELKGSLPAKALSHGAHETHDIATAVFEKAAGVKTEDINGPSTGERPEETRSAPEARKEEHELAPRSKGSNVLPRENRKETGGSKGVARSQPR